MKLSRKIIIGSSIIGLLLFAFSFVPRGVRSPDNVARAEQAIQSNQERKQELQTYVDEYNILLKNNEHQVSILDDHDYSYDWEQNIAIPKERFLANGTHVTDLRR